MRKRKERTLEERSETLISNTEEINEENEEAEEAEEEEDEEGKGFYACYLLCSLCPRFKGHTYIGYTVNPCRRIRQHNGELTSGAVRTKRKRPWEMMLCIYGFPTNVSALKFEWAWQHPIESLAVRGAALSFKSLSGIANRVKLAFTMLTLPPWQSLKLTVNFFSTAYTKHAAGCPSLPNQMKVQVCSMDELPCYTGDSQISDEIDYEEEWEHEDGENGIGEISQSESSNDTSVENSVAYPNTDHDWERLIEDDGLQQQKDSHSLRKEDNERPSCEDGQNGIGEISQSERSKLSARLYPLRVIQKFGNLAYRLKQPAVVHIRPVHVQGRSQKTSYGEAKKIVGRRKGKKGLGSQPNRVGNCLPLPRAGYAPVHVSKVCSVENSVAYPNAGHHWERLIEDSSQQKNYPEALSTRIERPSRDVDSSPEALSTRIERPSRDVDSSPEALSTRIARLVNKRQIVDESILFGLFAETGDNKLGKPTKKILTTTPDASGDQSPPHDSSLRPPEVPSGQPKESLTSREGASLPSFTVGSPPRSPSFSISRFVDTAQAVESRDSIEMIEETGCKFGRTRLPSFVVDSPLLPPSSSCSRFVDTVQAVEDRDSFELIVETGSELGRASTQQTTTMTASSEDHSPSKTSPLCPPEVCFRQPMKQGRFPFCVPDSPMEKPLSSVIEFPYGLIPKGCVNKMNVVNKQKLRTPANDNYEQPASSSSAFHPSPEVEVINLLTPSPDCTIDSFSNKRRTLDRRDIIDLTRSPMFVQL